jgi:hypothetical protein
MSQNVYIGMTLKPWPILLDRYNNNYVLTDEKSLRNKGLRQEPTTPAKKLGIADKKYTINDILDFTVASKIKNLQQGNQ